MEKLLCNSCKKEVVNDRGTTRFICPECAKYEIIRCSHCRRLASQYVCVCGFSGPN